MIYSDLLHRTHRPLLTGNGKVTAMRRKTRKPFLTFRFFDIQFSEFVWSQDMPCFTRRAIGEALGYPVPETAVDNIARKVPSFHVTLEVESTDGLGRKCK
jgi:hypothetical protein